MFGCLAEALVAIIVRNIQLSKDPSTCGVACGVDNLVFVVECVSWGVLE